MADYKRVVLAIDGVGGLQVYPTWDGGGTVKLSIIGADWMPASEQLVEAVQNTVDPPPDQGLGYGTAPIGATVTVTAPETVSVDVSAVLTLGPGYTIGQLSKPAQRAIDAYLAERADSWVYAARVTAALLAVPGVVNVTSLTLNGSGADLRLEESGQRQQVPVLGEVRVGG